MSNKEYVERIETITDPAELLKEILEALGTVGWDGYHSSWFIPLLEQAEKILKERT